MTDARHFSRRRTLDFVTLICWFLGGNRASVQTELDRFFAVLRNQAELVRCVSAQALSKARQNLPHIVFTDLTQHLLALVEQHLGVPRWHGLRIVAADASDVRLTTRDATRRVIRYAKVFALYLPGVEMMLRATLYGTDTGERQMLFEHLDLLGENDLLVLDRGYPASWLMAALQARGIRFCMRIDDIGGKTVKAFLRSGAPEAVVTLPAPNRQDAADYELERAPVKVRLIRVVTPEGLIRVLVTSLLDANQWPAAEFGVLYHQRWRVEEAFRRIKHRIDLESVSGLSWLAHQQDLAAKVLCDNLNSLLCLEALTERDGRICTDTPTVLLSPENALLKINRTRAFAHIRQCLPRWLSNALLPLDDLARLLRHIADNVFQFVPGRTRPRPPQPKPHKAFASKAVM
ncbi:IS4 family transposase [Paraburkholderia sp. CNPSo 3157]|uniref:IS4 family transposase n=1 Tax=Paraburkholderia franconis TaxID=2654983 RepID=A0A7X1NL08_9BURK|nr:IS4 family transposase [Paraburkholderia franconis]